MDVEEYIASGVLELYLTGTLLEEENFEVYQNALKYPEIKEEIWAIEAAIRELSKSVFPELPKKFGFDDLKNRIGESEVEQLPKKRFNRGTYASRAATVLFALGLLWSASEVSSKNSDIDLIDQQNQVLHHQIAELRDSLAKSNELLQLLKGRNVSALSLGGQRVSPDSHALVYSNKEKKKIYIDAQGLPPPPHGFVYQVWSFNANAVTPKSLGFLYDFLEVELKIFELDNPSPSKSEVFGITLELKGGRKTPTLEKLYVLGSNSTFP